MGMRYAKNKRSLTEIDRKRPREDPYAESFANAMSLAGLMVLNNKKPKNKPSIDDDDETPGE